METHSYCKAGQYHMSKGEESQDTSLYFENENYSLAVIADGVTACSHGREGAELSCSAVQDFLTMEGANLFRYEPKKLAYLITEHILFFLENKAIPAGQPVTDYSSTMEFACIEKKTGNTVLFHLGDGAIMRSNSSKWDLEIEPRRYNGNPCVITTRHAFKDVRVRKIVLKLDDSVFLCTDGFLHALNANAAIKQALQSCNFEQLDQLINSENEQDDSGYIVLKRTRR